MRWVFYSLLAINLLFFLWQLFGPEDPISTAHTNSARERVVPSIALLGESEDAAQPKEIADLAHRLQADLATESDPPEIPHTKAKSEALCDAFGPFIDRELVDSLIEKLRSLDIESKMSTEARQVQGDYWAYTEPQPSLEAALTLMSQLKREGIAAYLIREGELENGLSLGIFSNVAEAERLQAQLAVLNIEVLVEEKSSSIEEFWLLFTNAKLASLEPAKLARISKLTYQNQAIQKVCKPVASLE